MRLKTQKTVGSHRDGQLLPIWAPSRGPESMAGPSRKLWEPVWKEAVGLLLVTGNFLQRDIVRILSSFL